MTYAESTQVSSDKSRAEIERTLAKYGARSFAYGWNDDGESSMAMVGFKMNGRQVRFQLPLPDRESEEFTLTPAGRRRRSPTQQEAAYEQAVRQRWRALALVVKAKLEAVERDIVTFEEEFGPFMVLPDGTRMLEHMVPAIERAYATGSIPALLPGPKG